MVNPKFLCGKHLRGEHYEIHLHRHNFVKHHSITGRVIPVVQIEPESMGTRHDELAKEMLVRDMNHQSPYEMPDLSYLPDHIRCVRVDLDVSMRDLHERCPECKARYFS